MKKIILSLLTIAGISLSSLGQIEFSVEGDTTNTDYSGGGVYSFYATGDFDQVNEIHVENQSGGTLNIVVSRTRINRPASWEDYICWGHQTDPFGGTCFSSAAMDFDPWTATASQSVELLDQEYGKISSHITPSFADPGVVTYRYYAGTENDPFMDSMDLQVTLTPLNIDKLTPSLSVTVAPNPANKQVRVTAEGVESATIKMYDVLGNTLLSKSMTGMETIDVSEFRNGIYFISIEAKGAKKINRKVIVRH
ncbi:T9SS type A sorting domain-containing protein [Crocinitomicaceae bacterium]|nr:T9SS type A sorting domain-containing protein [Crocinitomicaceae bacterium]